MTQAADLLLDSGSSYAEGEYLLRASMLRRALHRANGNICHAAAAVGMHRNHFTNQLVQLNLRELPRQIRRAHKETKRQEQLALFRRPGARERRAAALNNAVA